MKKFFLVGMILTLCFSMAFSGCNEAKPPVANVTNGLIAWYPLNGNVEDAVRTGEDGILTPGNPISYTQDRLGNSNHAALFNGGVGYNITIPSASLSLSTSFSVSLWIKTGTSAIEHPVYCSLFGFRQEAGTDFKFEVVGTSSISLVSGSIPQGTWTHIVGTYDDSAPRNATFYINGRSVKTGNNSGSVGSLAITGLQLGASWAGAIDDFRIYNRVLTGAEANQLYKYRNN